MLLFALPLYPLAVSKSSAGPAAEKSDLLDISMATAEQLKALPGIGDALLREDHQGLSVCKLKDELVYKKILPRATYYYEQDCVVLRLWRSRSRPARA